MSRYGPRTDMCAWCSLCFFFIRQCLLSYFQTFIYACLAQYRHRLAHSIEHPKWFYTKYFIWTSERLCVCPLIDSLTLTPTLKGSAGKKTLVVLWYYVGPVKATDCGATSIRNVLFFNKLVVHQVGAMSFSITLVLIPSVISNIYNKPPPHSVNPLLCCVAVSKKINK